jgi:hypothetical protein
MPNKHYICIRNKERKETVMLEAIIGYSIGIIAAILRIRYVRKLEKQGKHTAWWHFWHDGDPFDSDTSYFY